LASLILGLADILTQSITVDNFRIIDQIEITDVDNVPFPNDTSKLKITFLEIETVFYDIVYNRFGVNIKRYITGQNTYYKEYIANNQNRIKLEDHELVCILEMYKSSYLNVKNEVNKYAKLFNEIVDNNSGTFDYKTACSRGTKSIREMCRKCNMSVQGMRKLFYSDT
jgi:hypothetical protein